MSQGPHALAIARSLEAMRARYAELPRATTPADRYSRELTLALHEVLMPALAAVRDERGTAAADEDFAQGLTFALGNMLCSLAGAFVPADTPRAAYDETHVEQTLMLVRATSHRAMTRALNPNREQVIWHVDPQPGGVE